MKEVCDKTGMTYETLKFYCNKGLVPNVKRCGMSIQEMLEYLDLCLQGQSTIPERQKCLYRKREALLLQIVELQESVAYIDWKQKFYNDVSEGRTPYYISQLISAAIIPDFFIRNSG